MVKIIYNFIWDESINKERLEPTEKQIRHKCNKNAT